MITNDILELKKITNDLKLEKFNISEKLSENIFFFQRSIEFLYPIKIDKKSENIFFSSEEEIPNNCNIVKISTDKAIKPTSILGLTKRIAEISCLKFQKLNPKSNISIVRFGNVFGSLGSAVPKFLEQLNKG